MKVNINPYKLRFVIIVGLIMAFSGRLYAQGFTDGGFNFSVIEPGKSCAVVGKANYVYNLIIPATASYDGEELSVTEIGDSAFYGNTGYLNQLTIPESVTKIGSGTFYGCTAIKRSITIQERVT